jgi:hydroxyacylglutathione hydrolase
MIFYSFLDEDLGHISYIVGDEVSRNVAIIDPKRDIKEYLPILKDLNLLYILNSHPHADYVGGHLEMKREFPDAKNIFDSKVPANFEFQKVKNRDILELGNSKIEILETAGHTPFCISFLFSEDGVSKAIFTGDALFVGDVGRSDLLGDENLQDLAKLSFVTVQKFGALEEHILVFPSHTNGSFCGATLQKQPFSTIGIEKRTNRAFQKSREEYLENVISKKIETPQFFKKMAKINIDGPTILEERELETFSEIGEAQIVDFREPKEFHQGHIKGSINIPYNSNIPLIAGSILDYDREIYIFLEENFEKVFLDFAKVGLEISGFISGDFSEKTPKLEAQDVLELSLSRELDGKYIELTEVRNLDISEEVTVSCKNGYRSSAVISYLKSKGVDAFWK